MKEIKDPESRAIELLSQMSIEEKMGQLVGYYPKPYSEEELEREYPHGAGQVACFAMREMKTLEEIASHQRMIQDKIMELSEHHIPAIFHMEGLCGILIREADGFPSGIGRAASWDPELEKRIGSVVGREAAAVGASMVLAPVLDISRDSRFGRQGETYGEDPVLAASMGTAYVEGIQEKGVNGLRAAAAAKHFLGYHNSQGGIHAANCDIPYRLLREVYAKPFQAAIRKGGLKTVMPCYSSLNGEPVSASREILTGLLREEMGFDGLAVSDYQAVSEIHTRQKVCESLTDAGMRALRAGMDMELPSRTCFNEELGQWFASGRLDMEILDTAVKRILTEKFRMGLFDNPYALGETQLKEIFHTEEASELTLQAALESLVLLKNDGILPIKAPVKKAAVIGYHAASTRSLFGGYTFMSMTERWLGARNTMAGVEEEEITSDCDNQLYPGSYVQQEHPLAEKLAKELRPDSNNLLEQLKMIMPGTDFSYAFGYAHAGEDMSFHEEALSAAEEADLVIVTVGGKYGTGSMASTGEGIDSTNINLPPCQEVFLEKLEKLHKPVICIHFDGRPISSDGAERCANAILEAWNPAERGAEAIGKVLLGEYNPGGKLPVSAAYHAGQEPVYYNHYNGSSYHQGTVGAYRSYADRPYEPRYFFGYGLSYTSFEYSDLTLSTRKTEPSGSVTATMAVSNTGASEGDEIVQLYLKDRYASMTRPVMELAGFRRIRLKPGESQNVTFHIQISQTAFLDINKKWKIEAGWVDVLIGASSQDIRLSDSFCITSDLYIDGKDREFYAETRIGQIGETDYFSKRDEAVR